MRDKGGDDTVEEKSRQAAADVVDIINEQFTEFEGSSKKERQDEDG